MFWRNFHADFKSNESAMNIFAMLQKKKKRNKTKSKFIPCYKHSIYFDQKDYGYSEAASG